MAPGIEVKPPSIRTGSALSAISDSENCTPDLAPHMMPATRATKPATDHTRTQMKFSEIPTDRAAWWSSATARMARPCLVYWLKATSAITRMMATMVAVMSRLSMKKP